ncbi:MAG TPA: efflux RND transporter permease subunit [Acidobacteriota bacterium]|nr:efflux RND transporter permease subunit [Acidobacteriota bacterium]
MKLPEIAIRRPVFIIVCFLIVSLLGAISFARLPIDLMPDISLPTITVTTTYDGVGPQEMEELVSIPLERTLSSVPGVREITSTSSEGSSRLRVSFEWGTNLDSAADDIRTRIDRVRNQLPDDADSPRIFKFDVSSFPIIFLGVSADLSPRDLREFAEKQLQYRFERIPGVAQADIWGGLERQIHVRLDRKKTHALRISPSQVIAALQRENRNEPAGHVWEGGFEVLMRTEGEYASLDEIRKTMVARREGRPIYIQDIAEVYDSHQEVRALVRVNGIPGLRMAIRKQSGANSVEVSQQVTREIESIRRDFPNVEVAITYDTTKFIVRSIENVRDAALYGSILAIVVLLLFLRNVRSTLVVAVSIPISVLATFALMHFYGFTLNTVTFGGLALGVGILVDNAIVVLENIFRHRQGGEAKQEAARKGTSEVALAITASTLTTIVVFIPVVFMEGITGVMFQQLAWVVSLALFSSLLVALTLVPLMSSRMIRVREPRQDSWTYRVIHGMSKLLDSLDGHYADALRWSLRRRWLIVSATAVVTAACLLLVPYLGFELQPEADEGEVRVSLELPQGTRLDVTDAMAREAEAIIAREVPEVENILTQVGNQGGWRVANTNTTQLRLSLVPQDQRTRSSQEIADALRPHFAKFPGVIPRIRASGGNFILRIAQGDGDRLSLDVRGYDLEDSYQTAVRLRRLLEGLEGVSDARIGQNNGRPESRIRVDRDRAASMGLSVSEIAQTVRTSIGGNTAGYFRVGGEEYDILVRYQEEDRITGGDVASIPIQTPSGLVVPLQSLVKFQRSEGPIAIERRDQQRIVNVSANLDGTRDMGSIVGDLQDELTSFSLPPDTVVVFSGEWEEQQEAFFILQLSLILAVVLVYLVMAAQFESFRYPFLIMFSLPLASIGVILMMFLTDTTFTMQAFIGAIMLVGIVVNNAIVLVDYVLQLRRDHGRDLVDSLITGGRRRLRPILMTTLTTVLGLTPMALGVGEGAELQAPMARVMIGGMLSSTFITLFLIPTLFLGMERFALRRSQPKPVGAAGEVVAG